MNDAVKNNRSDFFGADDEAWDHETGKPGIQLFANAIQVWAVCNLKPGRAPSVANAAEAFAVDPRMIVEAVNANYWMFLAGPDNDFTKISIEHEGE